MVVGVPARLSARPSARGPGWHACAPASFPGEIEEMYWAGLSCSLASPPIVNILGTMGRNLGGLVTYDGRLASAARANGLKVVSPL
ncbi:MAG: hypothetical protein ACLP1X_20785 [Polyangiaceae bacterium]